MFKVGDKVRYKHNSLKKWEIPPKSHWYTEILDIYSINKSFISYDYGDGYIGEALIEDLEFIKPLTEAELLTKIKENIEYD